VHEGSPIVIDERGNATTAPASESTPTRRAKRTAAASRQRIAESLVSAAASLALAIYGGVRLISRVLPFGPFKNAIPVAAADSLLMDWFGDVHVLLDDDAQAAAAAARLEEVVEFLAASGCIRSTVVAHSGGAIVTHRVLASTRTSPAVRTQLTGLITLGQGLNLAWELLDAYTEGGGEAAKEAYPDLLGKPIHDKPLRWLDVWSRNDPAPMGPIRRPRAAGRQRVRELQVWNRLSARADHGTYWDNDEEFIPALVREIDAPPGTDPLRNVKSSRFSRSPARRRAEAQLRGQRVRVAAWWSRMVAVGAIASLIANLPLPVPDYTDWRGVRLEAMAVPGDAFASAIVGFPGVALVGDFLGDLRHGIGTVLGVSHITTHWVGALVLAVMIMIAAAYTIRPGGTPPWPKFHGWRGVPKSGARRGSWLRVLTGSQSLLQLMLFYVILLTLIPIAGVMLEGPSEFVGTVMPEDNWLVIVLESAVFGLLVGAVPIMVIVIVYSLVRGLLDADSRGARGAGVLVTAVALAVGTSLVFVALYSVITSEAIGRAVLGASVMLALFALLGQLGNWRWAAWDQRERRAVRRGAALAMPFMDALFGNSVRGSRKRINRVAAVLYFGLLLLALGCLTFGFVTDLYAAVWVAVGLGVLIGFLGLAGDALREEDTFRSAAVERETATSASKGRRDPALARGDSGAS
jgi:hypothetical protein